MFVHLRQKARLRPELSPKFLSTLAPARPEPGLNPNPTRKALHDLQLWYQLQITIHFQLLLKNSLGENAY